MRELLDFVRDPFDPARNVRLFARHIEPRLPPAPCDDWPESLESALAGIQGWRETCPWLTTPSDEDVRAIWPELGPRARLLVATHDSAHATWGCPQDVAGEYELATLLLFRPDFPVERLYAALAMATLGLGCLRSQDGFTAPLRGVLTGLRRVVM